MKRDRGMNRSLMTILTGALLLATSALALDDGGGRSVFATGAGNRALAMGGAFAATADDASALIWNPAGLGLVTRKQVQASQTSLFGLGFSEQYASLVVPHWRFGTASLTYRRFGVDGIEGRDERGFLFDDNLEDAETELALGYGRLLAGGDLALGGALKVQSHQLAGYSGSGLGADLGLWARPLSLAGATGKARNLSLGLSLRNAIEPEIKLDQDPVPDPTTLRAGLAWTQPVASGMELLLATDLERSRDMDSRVHLGAELRVHRLLALRAGSSDGTLTAGAGLSYRGIGADYQYEDNELGDIHRFGVSLSFGATTAASRRAALAADEAELQQRLDSAFQNRLQSHIGQLEADARGSLQQRRWQDALDAVGSLAVLAPEHPDLARLEVDAWCGLAADQEQERQYADAAVSYRRALAVVPQHPRASEGLARVQAAGDRQMSRTRELKQRFDAALAAFAEDKLLTARDGFAAVLQLSPDDADAATMLERTEAAITRRATSEAAEATRLAGSDRIDEARDHLTAARRLDAQAPGLAAAATALRRAEQRREQSRQPDVVSQPFGDRTSTPDIAAAPPLTPERRRELDDLYRRGLKALEDGRRDEAVRYWELVWTADPDHGQVRDNLAQEYLARGMEAYAAGNLEDSVRSWQDARRVAPDDPRARGYLERAQQQLARMQKISRGDLKGSP